MLFHDAWMRGTQLVASFIRRNRKDYRQMRCPVKNMILFQKIGQDQRSYASFPRVLHLEEFFLAPHDYLDDAPGSVAEVF